jgi:ferritin-like metal-binding protein YciE
MNTQQQQQQELFTNEEIGTILKSKATTTKDLIRELVSLGIEVEIATDEVVEGDLVGARRTLEQITSRLETFLVNL